MAYQPQPYVYASEVGQTPVPPPQNWFVAHKALLVKIGFALLVLLVIALVVLFFVNRSRANKAALQAEITKDAEVIARASKKCDEARTPEKCDAAIATDLAESTGKVSFCNELTDAAFDNCVALAAMTAKSLTACDQVKDGEKQAACKNAVNALLEPFVLQIDPQTQAAIDAHNPDGCLLMSDENAQATCLELVGIPDRDLDGLNLEQELMAGSSDTAIDSDSDGLTDADEVNLWTTDPAKADTDADGYDDGVEAKGGYNPLGAG